MFRIRDSRPSRCGVAGAGAGGVGGGGGVSGGGKKTPIEEQWERHGQFGLTSVEQETHEKYFYGTEHWNYFTSDEDLGPVILSLKQENINGRDQFR